MSRVRAGIPWPRETWFIGGFMLACAVGFLVLVATS